MKLGIFYWSGTGNTKQMAEILKSLAEDRVEVCWTDDPRAVEDLNLLAADVLALGSPSHGIERLARPVNAFMKRYGDQLRGKKIILFGSYGWGKGKFMEIWEKRIKAKEGVLFCPPILAIEEPDEATRSAFKECLANLLDQA